jgi:hypothetical protein
MTMKTTQHIRSPWRQTLAAAVLLCVMAAPVLRAAEPTPLQLLLERAARHAGAFVEQFSDVKCTERVVQAKLGKNGHVEQKEEAVFDYLLMLQPGGGEILLEESRLAVHAADHKSGRPLMVTNGFSTMLLVFHPVYQPSFEFTLLEDENLDGKRYARIHFRHIPGARSPAVLLLRGREYPLDLEGTAWLDEETGAVAKLDVGLPSGMEDVGLRALHSEIRYASISFATGNQNYWLPASATIDVETPRQHWRNVHRFTDYQLFSVSATSTIKAQP